MRNFKAEGIIAEFRLQTFEHNGKPFDIDNLCDPLFSILVNKKWWFGGKRQNIKWWRASKVIDTNTGCNLQLLSYSSTEMSMNNLIFNEIFEGPLPTNAKDYSTIERISSKIIDSKVMGWYLVNLQFGSRNLNIGEIATGPVKSTIDCLFPLLGGSIGKPEDWRIVVLQVEKGVENIPVSGVRVRIGLAQNKP